MSQFLQRPWLAILAACLCVVPAAAQAPLRVFLRGGPKTHGPGEHDHPAFVADWKPLLEARGARVEGGLEFPTAEALARTDVLVLYAAEGGSIHGAEREHLLAYLARGGGIVALHDAVCGDDPHWFKTVIGGAWEHGHAKWATGTTDLYVRDFDHPITRGVANWRFEDELYTQLHVEPEARVLMAGFQDVFSISPQMWTYEKASYRAFVAIQGHYRKSFEHDAWRTMLLRGIAWAGGRDADLLTTAAERATLAYPTGGPVSPDKSRETLVLRDGFEASLVAAEPLVVNPISIEWDASGHTWVAETPGYPMKEQFSKRPARDTISVLVDADGDGRMDSKRVFAGGLDLVTSFVPFEDGVIASAAPDILCLRDTDGDGASDRREVLFTGFGFGDTHAVVSNLRWGPDGWIYATQGYSGGASTDVRNQGPEGERHFGRIGNGLFRFRPDGSAIEMVSSYGSNTWGCDFAPDGELFFTMANGAHLRHVVLPERALRNARLAKTETWSDVPDHDRVFPLVVRNEEAYRQIDFIGGFTAASGSAIYDGGAWPEEFAGDHFVAEPTVNLVHQDRIAARGTTYVASKTEEAEFLASADLWFRPVHMRVGPDGALYVLDFYNQAAVHNDTRGPEHGPTNAAVRPDRDQHHGRIWRVQHRAALDVAGADLARATGAQRIAALDSPNGWRRGAALRLLCESDDPTLASGLTAAARSHQRASGRGAALWALARRGEMVPALLASALQDADAGVRKTAAAIADELALATELRLQLVVLLADTDARVRLRALQALGAAQHDRHSMQAVIGTFSSEDRWTGSLALSVAGGRPVAWIEASLREPRIPELGTWVAELSKVVARSSDEGAAVALVCLLAERAPEEIARVGLQSLANERKSEAVPDSNPRLRAALAQLIGSPDFELAAVAAKFASAWDRDGLLRDELLRLGERLEREASDPSADPARRLTCLRALLGIAERRARALEVSESMLVPEVGTEVQSAVIDELARTGDDAVAGVLARRYLGLSPAAREQAFLRLVRRPRWVEPLLAEVEAGRIAPNDLGPLRLSQLRNHADGKVAERARAVLDLLQGPQLRKTEELIAQILPIVEAPGDVDKGKELFTQNCGTCHVYHGAGTAIGPDLTGMGAHGVRALLPVILDPNASVEAAYLEYVAETTDERLVSGILVRDTPQGVVLRASTGDTEIPRDELLSLRSTGRSPMPAGLESIGPVGLRDILAYLTTEYPGFRVLDLRALANMSTRDGMYDPEKAPDRLRLTRYGVFELEGVPFEVRDPDKTEGGRNVICLRGGMRADWHSRTALPKVVEIPVGFALERLHVLGGIAAWGFPCRDDKQPAVKWTWVYEGGARDEVVLHDGVEFADWIGRYDVPGSTYVEGLVASGSWGQVRRFELVPTRAQVVEKILLESYDNHLSPTFLGLTAELAGAVRKRVVEELKPADVVVFGGGSSHDFAKWFDAADLATLKAAGIGEVDYTERGAELLAHLPRVQALVLTNNQPLSGTKLREELEGYYAKGGAIVLVHPATWFNWADWPEFNARWVGGGARGHGPYGEFEVRVVDPAHPLARGVPATFRIQDELYETALDPDLTHVIAVGTVPATGKTYPVLWTVARARGRTACLTLGHDGAAHGHPAYQAFYANAVRWTMER